MAKEISRSGNWFQLQLGGVLQPDKPPLTVWVTAFFYKVWGVSEFTSRLFSSLAGLGTVLVTYFFGRQLLNRWMGFLSALILISTSHFIHYSRMATPDVPGVFFMTLALYFFWRGIQRNRFLVFSGITIGISVLSIGFQAFFIIPLIWIYLLLSGRHAIFNRSTYWVGLMLAALLALPWHLHQMVVLKDALWKTVDWQFFTSFRAWLGGEIFYYVRILVNKDHPWILFAIFSAPFFVVKAIKDKEDESVFLSVWIFFTLIILSFLREKRFEYVAPLYPALSITVSYWLGKIFKEYAVFWVRVIFILIIILHVPYSHIFDRGGHPDVRALKSSMMYAPISFEPIVVYRYDEAPAVIFYFSRQVRRVDQPAELEKYIKKGKFYCILREFDLLDMGGANFLQQHGLSILGSAGQIHMIGSKQ